MWYRLLPCLFLVAAGLVGLMGAFGLPTSPAAATLPLPPNLADPLAEQTLDRSIAALAPERIGFIETKLWQKVTLPNCRYEATGRYLMGPKRCFRLEMRTKQGDIEATRLAVCDGTTLWEADRVGSGEWDKVTRLDLDMVLAAIDGPGLAEMLRAEFLESPRFGGVVPLLRNVRRRMAWVKTEKLERAGKSRLRLTGVWRADFAAYVKSQEPWPAGLPEQCRLELDPATLWPYRLEWWGPTTVGAADTLLAQLEFRDPVVHTTLPPELCAKEFTFSAGNTAVVDQSKTIMAEYAARLRPDR
jgi:hypothetical protein